MDKEKIEEGTHVAPDFSVPENLEQATVSDLSESLKAMAEDSASIDNTIILK